MPGGIEIYRLTDRDADYNQYICYKQKWLDGDWADVNETSVICKNVMESDDVWAFAATATKVRFIKMANADSNGIVPVIPMGLAHM